MSNIPTVSVVIPLYNKGPHIAGAWVDARQTFQDFEVIVVNDGSIDDGVAVVKGFNDSRIRLIQQKIKECRRQENRGVGRPGQN